MTIVSQTGYLETRYLLDYPYLSGQIHDAIGMQVEMVIDKEKTVGMQASMFILDKLKKLGMQSEMFIVRESDDPHIGMQSEMVIKSDKNIGMQSEMFIVRESDDPHIGMQSEMVIKSDKNIGMQVELIVDILKSIGFQTEMIINDFHNTGMQTEVIIKIFNRLGMQAKQGKLPHWICEKYLNNAPYLTDSYLAGCYRTFLGMQAEMFIQSPDDDPHIGMQSEMRIVDHLKTIGMQSEMRVDKELNTGMQTEMRIFEQVKTGMQVEMVIVDHLKNTGMQVEMRIVDHLSSFGMQSKMIQVYKSGMQTTMVIYNITQLRILCNFSSRGTEALGGLNWVSMQAIKSGDFSPNNLNTDILEQRTQTDGIVNFWELRNDTGIPQGAFVDTLAIMEHNFTKSARVTWQGTNDPTYGSIGQNIVIPVELINMYWIAPTLPTESYKYWRFIIEDPTNPDGYLRIGTIVFGSSQIFTLRETFNNPVTWGQKHYKDSIETEGFTNKSNDRATRKYLSLSFSELNFDGGNYELLRNYFNNAKTDLKCLIIPRPTRPSSLAVFSKLIQLPEESHINMGDDNHHVSLSLDWDESL